MACAPAAAPAPPPAVAHCPPAPVCAPIAPPVAAAPAIDDVKDRALARFNAQDAPGFFDLFDARMQKAVPLDAVRAITTDLIAKKGPITSSKHVSGDPHSAVYSLAAERGAWMLDLSIDDAGKISGIRFYEAEKTPPVAQSDIPLALPFHGRWRVVWGGDRAELNHHIASPSQRRAADLVMAGDDGKTHRGDGKKNEDYLAFGKEILAVADGTVITVVDGVPENEPGAMNAYIAPGNMVILRHTPALYSVYAHLQPG